MSARRPANGQQQQAGTTRLLLNRLPGRPDCTARPFNGDAFSAQVKEKAIELIREDMGQVDLVVYSLAAPRRTMPDGTVAVSCLKTVGEDFTEKNLDLRTGQINQKTIPAATEEK